MNGMMDVQCAWEAVIRWRLKAGRNQQTKDSTVTYYLTILLQKWARVP